MQSPNPCTSWSQLEHVLPTEQREQLAAIILARLAAGWGEIVPASLRGELVLGGGRALDQKRALVYLGSLNSKRR